jgi:hypothetical protein
MPTQSYRVARFSPLAAVTPLVRWRFERTSGVIACWRFRFSSSAALTDGPCDDGWTGDDGVSRYGDEAGSMSDE